MQLYILKYEKILKTKLGTFVSNIFRRGSSVILEELIIWRGSPFEPGTKQDKVWSIKSLKHVKHTYGCQNS